MLATGERPRQLHWYHAGPMLFGDWGTSRLYVLGIAFFLTGRSSFWYLLAMSVLLVGVGWAYEVICRHYPEGGGVYSAARHRSHLLGVIGALLLCADYVVTASLSALDAFHYIHVPHPEWWAAGGILAIGLINFFGPTKAGTLALFVAIFTIGLSLVIAVFAAPHLPSAVITAPTGSVSHNWAQFTALILAISGVEAVANMTGIMVKPVTRTARLSIYPVLAEIVILNLVLTLALSALPDAVLGIGDPARMEQVRDTMLRVLAEYYVGPTFAAVASIVFAALLLSAVNTAVTDLVSIQYMMSHDGELPRPFSALNRWGMPALGLLLGTIVPVSIVLAFPDVGHLADLYAIGVVGAVAINLGACSTNFKLPLKPWERYPMIGLATLMSSIWLTIAWQKPHALAFAASILALGLVGRFASHNWQSIGRWLMTPVWGTPESELPIPERSSARPATSPPVREASTRSAARRILVCTHGNLKLLNFAIEQARLQNAELLVLFVRHLAILPMAPLDRESGGADDEAQALFEKVRVLGADAGVTVFCLYALSPYIADTILETAVTHGVNQVILGATQRGSLWRTMKGDVIQEVAQYLPDPITLVIAS